MSIEKEQFSYPWDEAPSQAVELACSAAKGEEYKVVLNGDWMERAKAMCNGQGGESPGYVQGWRDCVAYLSERYTESVPPEPGHPATPVPEEAEWKSYTTNPPASAGTIDVVSYDGRRFSAELTVSRLAGRVIRGCPDDAGIAIWRAPVCDNFGAPLCMCGTCESARASAAKALEMERIESGLFPNMHPQATVAVRTIR